MTTRYLIVAGVTEDGWVDFADPAAPDVVVLRRTEETHALMLGHVARIGDAHPFRVEEGADGEVYHYYAKPAKRRGEAKKGRGAKR